MHIGAAFEFNINFAANYDVVERILGPPEVPPFNTNPPAYEREITAGKFYKLSFLTVTPKIELGYDLQLGLGKYITPVASISLPVMSVIKTDNIRKLDFSFGVRYLMSNLNL